MIPQSPSGTELQPRTSPTQDMQQSLLHQQQTGPTWTTATSPTPTSHRASYGFPTIPPITGHHHMTGILHHQAAQLTPAGTPTGWNSHQGQMPPSPPESWQRSLQSAPSPVLTHHTSTEGTMQRPGAAPGSPRQHPTAQLPSPVTVPPVSIISINMSKSV